MCGRFTLRTPLAVLIEHFALQSRGDRQLSLFEPRYNIAPTQNVFVVRTDPRTGARTGAMLRWGLIPPWATAETRGTGPPLINARSETLATKPTFRTAFRQRRCLIPADGFYEWQTPLGGAKGQKQPYYIHRPDGAPFAFAGLWERWASKAGEPARAPASSEQTTPSLSGREIAVSGPLVIESCAIVTTSANRALSELHERMPVILSPHDYATWLDPTFEDTDSLQHMLGPCGEGELVAEPVGTHVNKVANDDARCIEVQRSLF